MEQNLTEPSGRCSSLSLVFRECESQRVRERLKEEGRDAQRYRDRDEHRLQEGLQRKTEEEGVREEKKGE